MIINATSHGKDNGALKEMRQSVLTFYLDGQEYGLPITAVQQIIKMVTITRLPQSPVTIQGIINVRGLAVPVMDLRLRFGLVFQPYGLHTPIILVDCQERTLGLVVDSVEAVVEIAAVKIEPHHDILPPDMVNAGNGSTTTACLAAIAKKERAFVPILDIEKILNAQEQKQLAQLIAAQVSQAEKQETEEVLLGIGERETGIA